MKKFWADSSAKQCACPGPDVGQVTLLGWPAIVLEWVERELDWIEVRHLGGCTVIGFCQCLCDRYLVYAVFGQRDANCVAQSICQEGANPNRALNPPIFAIACFGDTEMQGIAPIRSSPIKA